MSKQKPQYLIDAEAMEGAGYHDSPLEIHPPSTVIRRRGFEMYEEVRPAFVKISTGFKQELVDIDGNALKVWVFLALSINRNTEQAHPALRTIADKTGLSKDTVFRAVQRLETLGLLAVNREEKRYNIYEIPTYISANTAEPRVEKSVPIIRTDNKSVSTDGKSVSNGGESVSIALGHNQINQSNQTLAPEAGENNSRMKERQPGGTDAIKKGDLVDMALSGLQTDEKSIQELVTQTFGIIPNWRTVEGRDFLQWAGGQNSNFAPRLAAFKTWWNTVDFRGKTGQPPTLSWIKFYWPQAMGLTLQTTSNIIQARD